MWRDAGKTGIAAAALAVLSIPAGHAMVLLAWTQLFGYGTGTDVEVGMHLRTGWCVAVLVMAFVVGFCWKVWHISRVTGAHLR